MHRIPAYVGALIGAVVCLASSAQTGLRGTICSTPIPIFFIHGTDSLTTDSAIIKHGQHRQDAKNILAGWRDFLQNRDTLCLTIRASVDRQEDPALGQARLDRIAWMFTAMGIHRQRLILVDDGPNHPIIAEQDLRSIAIEDRSRVRAMNCHVLFMPDHCQR